MLKKVGLLLVILALLLSACAAPVAPAAAPAAPAADSAAAPAAPAEPFKVAIVMPSSTTDLAWSQSMYGALLAVQAEMGGESAMQIAYSENMFQVTDAAAALRDYASEGFNLVIAHGTQYGNSMFEIAVDFPETSFAWAPRWTRARTRVWPTSSPMRPTPRKVAMSTA